MIIEEVEFLNIIKKNINIKDENLLLKAFNFAKEAHKYQKRDGGEPYFVHPLAIAIKISEYKLDEASVIAGLLHDTVEDTEITKEDITKQFGDEISYLVDGLTKIESVQFKSKTEKNAENFRKLILSTAKDIRILIIKLIDVLNNMLTINGIKDKERRARFANETLILYVPLAERIGMYKLKLELEDLCFKELLPNERENILLNIKKAKKNQKSIIEDIVKKLQLNLIFENKINCRVIGREKKPYSIWKKMQKKFVSFEKLKDIIAFRIIVKDLQSCYKVFGCISSSYVLVPDTFKDYINKSKLNGYQSLHIVVAGPKNLKIEIQIRTEDMDKVAEYGIASHWLYKQNIKEQNNLKGYNCLQGLVKNLEDGNYTSEKFEDLKCEIYEDEIFCYTPKGDIIQLPIGATGIDFAYAIHRDIGNRCCGVKINGILSQFKTKLKSGDDIEVLTSSTVQVNEEWLEFVKTSKAKSEIKSFIRNSKQKEFEKIGRETIKLLSKELKIKITDELIRKNISNFKKGKSVEDIYSLIADGRISKEEFIDTIFPDFKKNNSDKNTKEFTKIKISIPNKIIGVEGLDKNIAYKYAKCCYPIPPDEIVGVINSGTGITVHKKNCNIVKNIQNEKIIDLEWNKDANSKYITKLNITLDSIPGILAKVVNLCAEKKINIIALTTINESEFYQKIELKIEVKNEEELDNFRASLRSIKGILEI